jgi:hypothetical protein
MTIKQKFCRLRPCGNQSSVPQRASRMRVTHSRAGRVWMVFGDGELVFFGSRNETSAWLRLAADPNSRSESPPPRPHLLRSRFASRGRPERALL